MQTGPIRVLIAEDSEPMRRYYAYVFDGAQEYELLPMATNGYEAVALAALHKPDVAMLDVEMESYDAGLRAGESILSVLPEVKIIFLTVHDDDATIFRAFELGAVGYAIKSADAQSILSTVREAHMGASAIRADISERLIREFRRLKHSENTLLRSTQILYRLSATERSILNLLVGGSTHKEICAVRCIEQTTLKTHIRNILQKFGLRSTQELIRAVNEMDMGGFLKAYAEAEE